MGRERVAIMKYFWSILHKKALFWRVKDLTEPYLLVSETLPTLALLSLSDLPKRKIKNQKHSHQGSRLQGSTLEMLPPGKGLGGRKKNCLLGLDLLFPFSRKFSFFSQAFSTVSWPTLSQYY